MQNKISNPLINKKKLYKIVLLIMLQVYIMSGQLTLTKAFNEPIRGDIKIRRNCDSVVAVPKMTGQNVLWDFSKIKLGKQNDIDGTSYYLPGMYSDPNFSANLVSDSSYNSTLYGCDYYKSTNSSVSQFEFLGFQRPGYTLSYTNSLIEYRWPISYGSTFTDTYTSIKSYTNASIIQSGSVTTSATGTGTLMLPNGLIYNDVLQLIKQTKEERTNYPIPPTTQTEVTLEYQYFHSSQKFPILCVQYFDIVTLDGTRAKYYAIRLSKVAIVGIENYSTSIDNLSVFPIPTSNIVNIVLDNNIQDNIKIELFDVFGKLVNESIYNSLLYFQNSIDLSGLESGVYYLVLNVNNYKTTRKIIKN